MEQHIITSKNLTVTRIGFGMAAIGRPGYINITHADDLGDNRSVDALEDHAHTMLDAAYDAGIRYFDAARSYGKAEAFLQTWLAKRGLTPDDITVGSKWGYTYTADWQVDADKHEVKEHSLAVLNRQWDETQAHLSNYLDLYQIHSATLTTGVLDNVDVLDRLAQHKASGTAIGLSLSGTTQAATLEKAMTVTIDGVRLFDTVQATWNILEQSTTRTLQAAHAAGMGIIIKEALANGRLTPANHHPDFAASFAVLERQAQRLDTTIDALAIAAVLAQDWCDVVLSGAATHDHLQSNLHALSVTWDDEAATALASLRETPNHYWEFRSNLSWQ